MAFSANAPIGTIFKPPAMLSTVRGRLTGKMKVLSEKELYEMILPSKNDVLDVVQKMLGFDRVMVKCQNGNVRVSNKG